ncbi:MAG: J domain-containing protein [Chloroflexota bacterium]
MPSPLLPDDDLYARLEVGIDASPEAIELAWRALLRRHHPDVAGDAPDSLEQAKRINVAHDWLSEPALRDRYDAERLGIGAGRVKGGGGSGAGSGPGGAGAWGVRSGRRARPRPRHPAAPRGPRRHATRPDLAQGEPAERLRRFLDRVARLTPDELDRLAVAEPPPIAFLATIHRFLEHDARAAFREVEQRLAALLPHERWADTRLREALLGVAAELSLAPFLDDTLDEPFRSRARARLLRAWDASLEQPRWGPNGAGVAELVARMGALAPEDVAAFVHASTGIGADVRPWPEALDREADEALRISAILAARDVAAALPEVGLTPVIAARATRLAARMGHIVALRHAFTATRYAELVAPWTAVTGTAAGAGSPPRDGAGVRRAD